MATPAQLVENARCLDCAIPAGMQLPVLIALFVEIADVPLDAATLVANARCLECIPAGMQMAVLISLADTIASAPAPTPGAAAGCMPSTSGNPEGVLVSTCTPSLAVDPATQAVYLFTGVAGTSVGWSLKV